MLVIKKSNIYYNVICILLYHIIFVRWSYFEKYDLLKYGFIAIEFAMILIWLSRKKRVNELIVNILCMCFMICALYSSFRNPGSVSGSTIRGIVYVFMFFEVITVVQLFAEQGKMKMLFKVFYFLSLFYAIISDIILLALPNYAQTHSAYYFIGNKFVLAYMHIYIILFFLLLKWDEYNYKNNKIVYKLIIYFVWSIAINLKTECSTGLVGSVVLVILLIFFNQHFNAKNWLIILGISDVIFVFFNTIILSQPIVQYFITDILGESLDLHGRLQMYTTVIPVFLKQPLWGYGCNNYYPVLYSLVKAPNAQNGILNCIIQFGIIGTIILVIVLFLMLKKSENVKECYPLYALIIMMTIISSVEITIDIYFIFFCTTTWGLAMQKKREIERKRKEI